MQQSGHNRWDDLAAGARFAVTCGRLRHGRLPARPIAALSRISVVDAARGAGDN
jgi:hypothetical protein